MEGTLIVNSFQFLRIYNTTPPKKKLNQAALSDGHPSLMPQLQRLGVNIATN
jgi:hypothetical protein